MMQCTQPVISMVTAWFWAAPLAAASSMVDRWAMVCLERGSFLLCFFMAPRVPQDAAPGE